MDNKIYIQVHTHLIYVTKAFMDRYVKPRKFASLFWDDSTRKLTTEFHFEDSDVARRYYIKIYDGGGYINCAKLLHLIQTDKNQVLTTEDMEIDISSAGNITFTTQL